MTETPAGYYTDADAIRMALGKNGPLSRADLVKASDLPRDVLAKALYALKKQGDVIEEGDLVMLATVPIIAQDERKEAESMEGTTQAEKSDSGPVSVPTMGVVDVGFRDKVDALRKLEPVIGKPEDAGSYAQDLHRRGEEIMAKLGGVVPSPFDDPHPAIVALHDAATHLADLLAENRALAERIKTLELRLSTVSEALDAAERIQEKMQKLREVLG